MGFVQLRRQPVQLAAPAQAISVRHAEASDADALHAIFTDPEVMHWLIDVPYAPQAQTRRNIVELPGRALHARRGRGRGDRRRARLRRADRAADPARRPPRPDRRGARVAGPRRRLGADARRDRPRRQLAEPRPARAARDRRQRRRDRPLPALRLRDRRDAPRFRLPGRPLRRRPHDGARADPRRANG